MVLLPGEEVESGFGFFGETLGAVITCRDFEVKASEFSALVLVLDAKVGNRNLIVHNFEVAFICHPDSLVGQFLVGIDPRQLPVEVLLEFVVKDDTAKLAARIVNFPSDLVVEPVEIGVVACFLGLYEAVVDCLPIGDELCSFKKSVAIFCQSQNSG